MLDWVTISSLATAGGTLVLAVATFSSVRSANRSARVAEQSLLVGLRPVITPSKEDDPAQRVRFGDGPWFTIPSHGGTAARNGDVIYLTLGLRNGGNGLGVIHGWTAGRRTTDEPPVLPPARRQQIDLYVPAGEVGMWLGALRDPAEPGFAEVAEALEGNEPIQIDLHYGDYEGGQRAVARFLLSRWEGEGVEEPPDEPERRPDERVAIVLRYYNLDGRDPRGNDLLTG